jgi:1,4-dihydroxy-2-naphthoyl-CoA hydrolase
MRQDIQPPFADMLGIKVISNTPDRIEAELSVRPNLGNRNGNMHGGAVMAFADDLGGAATIVNLPEGATTATIESKTNFFAAIHVGDTARAECIALHKGRTTMVWQTRITRASDGKLAAIVTQTQLVIAGKFGK